MRSNWIPRIAWTTLLLALVYTWVYHRHLMPVTKGDQDIALFSRGIGTPLLLWLNGYLGIFLNLQFLGPVGVFAMPLIVGLLWHWRSLQRWHQGLLLFVLMAAVVIGLFGGFNYRYALTLQPLLAMGVVAAAWKLMEGRSRGWFITGLVAICLLNTALALEHRQRTWRADPDYELKKGLKKTFAERFDDGPRDLAGMLDRAGVGPQDSVLVNNLPIWYYRSTRPGVYYWSGSDQLFLADGKPFLFRDRDDAQVTRYLVDTLGCRHIFSQDVYAAYNERFSHYLEARCDLVGSDDRGYTLHRVRDTFGR